MLTQYAHHKLKLNSITKSIQFYVLDCRCMKCRPEKGYYPLVSQNLSTEWQAGQCGTEETNSKSLKARYL